MAFAIVIIRSATAFTEYAPPSAIASFAPSVVVASGGYAFSTDPKILASKSVGSFGSSFIPLPVDFPSNLFWLFIVSLMNFFIRSAFKFSCSSLLSFNYQ
ncbi:MAG TPA: hypothetical protein VIK26_05135 [Clostridium sp.]